MDIIRISLLGICGVVLGFFLKGTRTEYVSFITMGIGIIILGLAVDKLDYLFRMIGKIQQSLSVDPEYFLTLIKMIGITCLGEFTCDFCKDCGQEALGRQISMAARLTILVFSMPIVLAVLKNVSKLM